MTWFADLELCRYHVGPFRAENWSVPLRAVGWLEAPNAFETGVGPEPVVQRLRALVSQACSAHSHYYFRGGMGCSWCLAAGLKSPGPIWSQENIFVPGTNVVYVSPGGIVHYVESHSYLPPAEFIEAVLKCPDLQSEEYRRALYVANGNSEPPLESSESYERRRSEWNLKWASARGTGKKT
jgi:hypothetical protein